MNVIAKLDLDSVEVAVLTCDFQEGLFLPSSGNWGLQVSSDPLPMCKDFCSVPAYIYVLDMQGASLHAAVLLLDAHLGLLRTRLGSQLVAPNSHPTPLPSVHIVQDLLCTTMQ